MSFSAKRRSPEVTLGGHSTQQRLSLLDGKGVFMGIPDMKPAMQMRLGWSLATRGGARFEQNAYFTPRELTRFDSATKASQR